MQETTNYKLKKPEGTDPVNVADFNENADVIDLELSKRVESAGGDISDTKIGAADTAAQEFPVPAPGDTARGFLGKMRKFCSDFNSFKTGVITLGKLVNNGLTTEEGYALDARYGKTLLDMVTRLNSDLGGLNSNLETVFNTTPLSAPNTIKAYADSLSFNRKVYYIYYMQPTDAPDSDWGLCRIARYDKSLITVDAMSFSGKHYSMVKNNIWGVWKYNIQSSDLHNPYKTYLLTWGNYSDGTYTLLESIIGRGISITAGTNGRLRGTWIPSSINDLRSIVIPGGGVIDVKILSATRVQITGTTSEYRIRDISAI